MTNIDEVRISCQKGNLKTTPSISVYFLSLFQSKLGELFYGRQVARFLLFFRHTNQNLNFGKTRRNIGTEIRHTGELSLRVSVLL